MLLLGGDSGSSNRSWSDDDHLHCALGDVSFEYLASAGDSVEMCEPLTDNMYSYCITVLKRSLSTITSSNEQYLNSFIFGTVHLIWTFR